MSKKQIGDSGQNPIPELAHLALKQEVEQKQKEEQSKIFNDDSEDSSDELEVKIGVDGSIKKSRKKLTGDLQEDYDIYAQCDLFLAAKFVQKKGSSAKKKAGIVDEDLEIEDAVKGEEEKSDKKVSKAKKVEAKDSLLSKPYLLQYSFLSHALGLQLLRSAEVNQYYKPLKQTQLTEASGRRNTLPRHYTFRSRSAPEFLANQRLWSRSLTRENRNLLDNPEYREGIEEINSARPQDAIEVISRFWEFTDEKRPQITGKTLESTKFIPKIFSNSARDFLGEEHYVQQGGSVPSSINGVAEVIKSELTRDQERSFYKTLMNQHGYRDIDAEFLIQLRETQREAEVRGKTIISSKATNQSELLDESIELYRKQRDEIISNFSSCDISEIMRRDLEGVENFTRSLFEKNIQQLKQANSQTSTQAIRLLAVEPRRNPASFILHQMALDLIDSGNPSYSSESIFSMIPMTMSVEGAKDKEVASTNATVTEVARSVNKKLNPYMPYNFFYPGVSDAPDYLQEQFMLREGLVVFHWISDQRTRLEQELKLTKDAALKTENEAQSTFFTAKQARCEKYLSLCGRLIPGPTDEPVVKITQEDMTQLVELIDLNCKVKWYARSKAEQQNTGKAL